jgi:hypothetical protein
MQLLAVVTLHDAYPALSSRTFEIIEHLEELEIKYTIGLMSFLNEEGEPSVCTRINNI